MVHNKKTSNQRITKKHDNINAYRSLGYGTLIDRQQKVSNRHG